MKKVVFIGSVVFASLFLFSFVALDGWDAPAEFKSKANPLASDEESLETGKELYISKCKMCHGIDGKGSGTKAGESDLSSADFQAQTDGEIFWKLIDGKGKMPGYPKKLPDENDRWCIVNYVRTLK